MVDAGGLLATAKMWLMLRALPGLDLPNFLEGSRVAYTTVSTLMYAQDWEALDPLVSPAMMTAMQQTMEELSGDGRRVMGLDDEDAIAVHRAVLREVLILEDEDESVPNGTTRRCHLDVLFVSHEKWQMWDYHTNEALAPFDGSVRVQETTWRFEGVVAPTVEGEEPAGRESGTAEDENEEQGWTVHAIV